MMRCSIQSDRNLRSNKVKTFPILGSVVLLSGDMKNEETLSLNVGDRDNGRFVLAVEEQKFITEPSVL